MPRLLVGLACCFLFVFDPALVVARTWTDQQGRTIDAEYVRVTNGSVVLLRGIKVFAVPFESFSPADQDYVRLQLQPKKPAAANASQASDPSGDDATTASVPQNSSPVVPPVAPIVGTPPASKPAVSTSAGPRTWTDFLGRKLTAEFVSWAGKPTDAVVLRKGSESLSITFSKFSTADQEYLHTTVAGKASPPAKSASTPLTAPPTAP